MAPPSFFRNLAMSLLDVMAIGSGSNSEVRGFNKMKKYRPEILEY